MSSNSITSTAREHVFPLFVKYVSSNVLGMIGYSCYILADTFFVARGIGSDAIAALNLVLPAFSLLNGTGLMIGMGAAARYSISSGRADSEIHRTIFTQALQLAFVAMLFFFSIGLFFARPLCVLLGADGTTLPHAIPYISILLMFSPLFLCNNLLNCFVRNDGEPRLSMTAMLVGSLTNIVLDIAFVIGLHMGVAGAALATILSQALSAVLVLWVLMRTKDMHRLELRKIRFDGRMFHRIIRIGLPAGLQSVMYTSSNILIQSSVNELGTDTVAAWTAYSKIDSLFWMIVNAFGISITTFVGQNYGAGKMDRVHKGVRTCMGITAGATVLLSVILYNYASICYQLFTTDAQVVVIGEQILHFLVPTYFTYIAIEILSGTLRGIGDSWLPMIICCLGICVLRVVWILTAVPLKNDILTIVFSYPLTWTVTSIAFIVYYLFFSRLKTVGSKR